MKITDIPARNNPFPKKRPAAARCGLAPGAALKALRLNAERHAEEQRTEAPRVDRRVIR
jgi:hypothetical protein